MFLKMLSSKASSRNPEHVRMNTSHIRLCSWFTRWVSTWLMMRRLSSRLTVRAFRFRRKWTPNNLKFSLNLIWTWIILEKQTDNFLSLPSMILNPKSNMHSMRIFDWTPRGTRMSSMRILFFSRKIILFREICRFIIHRPIRFCISQRCRMRSKLKYQQIQNQCSNLKPKQI